MVQIKRVFLTEKFMICLINKWSFIFLTQSKIKTEFSQFHWNEIQFRCHKMLCYVMLCYARTSSLADIQALVFLLIHSQNVLNYYSTNKPYTWKNANKLLHQPVPFMKSEFYVLRNGLFFYPVHVSFLGFFYLYIFILRVLGKLL